MRGGGGGGGRGVEEMVVLELDAGKHWASLGITIKALIPRQEGRIVQLSGLDVERKNLEFSVSKKKEKERE